MGTGIFRRAPLGLEEVPQDHIDFWCHLCQFPFVEGGCKDKADIQKCWDGTNSIGNAWHKQHECPFIHKGEQCRCNDFKSMTAAFLAAGLEYRSAHEPNNK